MSNPNKAKGTAWERDLLTFFRPLGINAFRPRQEGHADVGDLHGLSPFVGQAKNWTNWQAAIREGLDGSSVQAVHAGEPFGVAFVKRARRPVAEGYAVMTVGTWADVLLRLRTAESDAGSCHCRR